MIVYHPKRDFATAQGVKIRKTRKNLLTLMKFGIPQNELAFEFEIWYSVNEEIGYYENF
jgi:hypothetical protein